MLRNYLKIAFRSILKNRTHVLINVLGLGIALAFSITIYLIFAFNMEFDRYYIHSDAIYRIHSLKTMENGKTVRHEVAPIPMGSLMSTELPGIEKWSRYIVWGENISIDKKSFNQRIAFVDPDFLDMFQLPLKYGPESDSLEKSSIYLTDETAERYFGKENPIGQTMTLHFDQNRSVVLKVAGVFEKIPVNSSFIFQAMVHFDHFLNAENLDPMAWTHWIQPGLYLQLSPRVTADQIRPELEKYMKHYNEERPEWQIAGYDIVGFKESDKLGQRVVYGGYANFRIGEEVLIVFSSMALLILLIACFNLANSSMAMMSTRIKEIGMRKVMGSNSSQIFIQFLFEMLTISFLSLITAFILAQYIAPEFWSLWGLSFSMKDITPLNLVLGMIFLLLFASLLAGLYPAIYSKRFQPVQILNRTIRLKGTNPFTRILLTLQFSISVIVLVAGMVFTRNSSFLTQLPIGYDREEIIHLGFDNHQDYENFWNAVHQNKDLVAIAGAQNHIGFGGTVTYVDLDTSKVEVWDFGVGTGYLETMQVKLLEGRLLSDDYASDFTENIVVNQYFADQLLKGKKIGALVKTRDGYKYVVGIIDNFIEYVYAGSITRPLMFHLVKPELYQSMVVKTDHSKIPQVMEYLEKEWKENIQYKPFSGRTQDEVVFAGALSDNNNLQKTFYFLALLGIIMSVSGIYSLASLNTAKRTKEIGIRKVLGASVHKLVLLINKEFMIILSIAMIVGSGLGYILTKTILSLIYQYHVDVGLWVLGLSSIVILIIGLSTTTFTILKTANSNPADTLRDE
jgi:ABC-type antimicrobial peptide transport system permease subunit